MKTREEFLKVYCCQWFLHVQLFERFKLDKKYMVLNIKCLYLKISFVLKKSNVLLKCIAYYRNMRQKRNMLKNI